MIFYKDDFHEEQTRQLLDKFKKVDVLQDIEYGSFSYMVGATYKANQVENVIDEEGHLDVDKLYEVIAVFSTSEQNMIRFGLQLFNSSIDDIALGEVMRPLDEGNTQVVKQGIEIRY